MGKKCWYQQKGLVTMNVHMKPLTIEKLLTRLKFLKSRSKSKVKVTGQ